MAERAGIKVQIQETGETFDTIRDCAKRLNVNANWLGKVVRGNSNNKTCRGYHILRINESPVYTNYQEHRGRPGMPIKIQETGETYPSIAECARAIDGNRSAISEAIDGKNRRVTHKGFHFIVP